MAQQEMKGVEMNQRFESEILRMASSSFLQRQHPKEKLRMTAK